MISKPAFLAQLGTAAALACLMVACKGSGAASGVSFRHLQDSALAASANKSRCPRDLNFPKIIGELKRPDLQGGIRPLANDEAAAAGAPLAHAAPGAPTPSAGSASYRCAYKANGHPVTLVVVAVPPGRQTSDALNQLPPDLEGAGLNHDDAQTNATHARSAKTGQGEEDPYGDVAIATADLPGGGAAAVAIVAVQSPHPPPPLSPDMERTVLKLTQAAESLASELQGKPSST